MNWLLTFNAVNIAWIFFRAASFNDAWNILIKMFSIGSFFLYSKNIIGINDIIALGGFIIIILLGIDTIKADKIFSYKLYWVVLLNIMFVYSILKLGEATSFLYFQF